MRQNVTFGQYYPTGSIIHRLDPRLKILLSVAMIVEVFLIQTYVGFAILGAYLLLTILLSKIPLTTLLKTVRGVLFLVLFTAICNLFLYNPVDAGNEYTWWIFRVSDASIDYAVRMALRLVMLVMSASMLTLVTTPIELTDGIESLLSPLKVFKFPTHDLALIMSIALRFVPTLMDETDKIMMAQKSRGADFESGGLISRAKALVPILIPLLVSAFRRAEELAEAMDSRCYNTTTARTRRKVFRIGYADVIAIMSNALLLLLIISANVIF
ncbi:MAG: energy-coupling factor transporter transmembrane protein EcfT [Clostridia bacterium]|nr:energy-coupling factor transporter transmembrane protein EcfT [Clostridia bacterium]MBR7160694.1 energy-coupling factor transporter transmembrane protein EcfT [Clostridia bacterium]